MDILNISQDDNESDTSQEDLEEDEDTTVPVPDDKKEANPDPDSFQKWKRPQIDWSSDEDEIRFCLLDTDFGIISTKKIHPELIPFLHPELQEMEDEAEQSYVRLHGVTVGGNSVCCNVFNFLPYFYALPMPGSGFRESSIPEFQERLSKAVAYNIKSQMKSVPFHDMIDNSESIILKVEIINLDVNQVKIFDFFQDLKEIKNWESTLVTTGEKDRNSIMLKITCRVPKFVWVASKVLKHGIVKYPLSPPGSGVPCTYEVYEGNINHTIRFMTDNNFPGCSWLGIRKGHYFLRHNNDSKLSIAQLEFDVSYTSLYLIPEQLISIPPVRILSFDIEVMTRPPNFPFPVNGKETVIQIGNTLATYGITKDTLTEPIKVIFTLGSCVAIPGTEVFSYADEKELLNAWREFVLTTDPDILTGYNIKRFDLPYLLERAHRIDINSKLPYLGRLKSSQICIREVRSKAKRCTRYDDRTVRIQGRIVLDMMLVMMRHNTKPRHCAGKFSAGEFTLGEVGRRYLNDTKEDVKHTDIFALQEKGPETRKIIATYCIQDSKLPYDLMLNHVPEPKKCPGYNVLEYYFDLARSSGIPLKYLVSKSQDYHSYFRRIRKAKHPEVTFGSPVPSPQKKPVTLATSNSSNNDSVSVKSLANLGGGGPKNSKKTKFW